MFGYDVIAVLGKEDDAGQKSGTFVPVDKAVVCERPRRVRANTDFRSDEHLGFAVFDLPGCFQTGREPMREVHGARRIEAADRCIAEAR